MMQLTRLSKSLWLNAKFVVKVVKGYESQYVEDGRWEDVSQWAGWR